MYLKVLIIEDSEDDAALLGHYLKSCGFDPRWHRVDREEELAEAVEDRRWDLVLCDLAMPELTPHLALDCVRKINPDIPFIIVTGAISDDVAIELLQYGVQDVVLKDDLPHLKTAIGRELALAQSRRAKTEAELRLAGAIENLDQGVALYDSGARLITCNKRYKYSLDRFSEAVVPGVHYGDLLNLAFEKGQFQFSDSVNDPLLSRILAYNKPTGDQPLEFQHHDGRWVKVGRFPTEDGGIVTVTTDITENKRREAALMQQTAELARVNDELVLEIQRREASEDALRESESRARAIFESAVDGVITFNENFLIETVNPAAETIFGYSADELKGLHIHHLMLLGSAPVHESAGRPPNAPSGTGAQDTRLRLVTGWRKDGEAFPIEMTVSPVELHYRCIYTAIVRDVTERTKLDRMKSEFVSVVSHELRTPLTSIRGALALLNTSAVGELPERARSMVSIGLQNCERLLRIINDILDMEKIESGKIDFAYKLIETDAFLDAVVLENRTILDQFKLSLEMVNEAPGTVIRGDAGRLMQAMANLCSNAAKYSPEGGTIKLGATMQGKSLRIWVKDEGPGIPQAFRDRIFQKFSQADGSDTRQKGGTGLGLSITKMIVERHGGTISFETEQGRGTTFYFDLPLYDARARNERQKGAA
jgi:PAS domain S-box-containing protein